MYILENCKTFDEVIQYCNYIIQIVNALDNNELSTEIDVVVNMDDVQSRTFTYKGTNFLNIDWKWNHNQCSYNRSNTSVWFNPELNQYYYKCTCDIPTEMSEEIYFQKSCSVENIHHLNVSVLMWYLKNNLDREIWLDRMYIPHVLRVLGLIE